MPQATLTAPFARTYASGSLSTIGLAAVSHFVGATQLGGYYANPFHLPLDFDVSRPAHVRVLLRPVVNGPAGVYAVWLTLTTTILTPDASFTNLTYDTLWPTPDTWLTSQLRYVLIEPTAGITYPAHTFTPGQLLGLRIVRDGPKAGDTFPQLVDLLYGLQLTYYRRCQLLGCP